MEGESLLHLRRKEIADNVAKGTFLSAIERESIAEGDKQKRKLFSGSWKILL